MVSRSIVSLKGYDKVRSSWSYIHTHTCTHTVHKNRILYFGGRVYSISNPMSSNNRRSIIQRRSLSTNWVKSHVPWSYHLPRCYLNQYLDPEKKRCSNLMPLPNVVSFWLYQHKYQTTVNSRDIPFKVVLICVYTFYVEDINNTKLLWYFRNPKYANTLQFKVCPKSPSRDVCKFIINTPPNNNHKSPWEWKDSHSDSEE